MIGWYLMMNATPKKGISYVWRSIPKGMGLLKIGFICRVGNGENISVWSDPSIPRGSTLKIKVCESFGQKMGCGAFLTTLWPEDADIILKIHVQEDTGEFLSCHHDKRSVNSW
jgi:hypothetical protein